MNNIKYYLAKGNEHYEIYIINISNFIHISPLLNTTMFHQLGIDDDKEKQKETLKHIDLYQRVYDFIFEVNRIYDFDAKQYDINVDIQNKKIELYIPPKLENKLQDNQLWEDYLTDSFGDKKKYRKILDECIYIR